MRYFPELTFKFDDSVDKHMRIEELLTKMSKERETRKSQDDHDDTSD